MTEDIDFVEHLIKEAKNEVISKFKIEKEALLQYCIKSEKQLILKFVKKIGYYIDGCDDYLTEEEGHSTDYKYWKKIFDEYKEKLQ